tara:strand:+ start:327 stop:599 length:273 start_codon:yes stop_codon:yes gene_type:complete
MTKKNLKKPNLNNPQIREYNIAVKKGIQNQHVLPIRNGWAVRRLTVKRPAVICGTQKEAINKAKKIAKKQRVDLFIHNREGRIRGKYSYR